MRCGSRERTWELLLNGLLNHKGQKECEHGRALCKPHI